MCIQGWQILDRCSLQEVSVTANASDRAVMPDLSRCVMLTGLDSNNEFALQTFAADGSGHEVPSDTRFAVGNSAAKVYTRDSLGPYIRSTLFLPIGAGEVVRVWLYLMDADAYLLIKQPVIPIHTNKGY